VRAVFGPVLGAVLGAALDVLESAEHVLFDSVEQVHMDSWHRGRVVLVGDAAWCVTPHAGMGASSGMAESLTTQAASMVGPRFTCSCLTPQTKGPRLPGRACSRSSRARPAGAVPRCRSVRRCRDRRRDRLEGVLSAEITDEEIANIRHR
jgi:hypothetical protein